jgi:hypothetical protein
MRVWYYFWTMQCILYKFGTRGDYDQKKNLWSKSVSRHRQRVGRHWPLAVQGAIMISLETSACGTTTLPCHGWWAWAVWCGFITTVVTQLKYVSLESWESLHRSPITGFSLTLWARQYTGQRGLQHFHCAIFSFVEIHPFSGNTQKITYMLSMSCIAEVYFVEGLVCKCDTNRVNGCWV